LMRQNEEGSFNALDCAGLKAGERHTRPVTAGGLDWGAATLWLEVGGGPDGRAPPASDRAQKKRRGGARLASGETSWAGWAGLCMRAREKKASGLGGFAG
jgi:hypothetical protein